MKMATSTLIALKMNELYGVPISKAMDTYSMVSNSIESLILDGYEGFRIPKVATFKIIEGKPFKYHDVYTGNYEIGRPLIKMISTMSPRLKAKMRNRK